MIFIEEDKRKTKVVIMRGLPGSGKSHYATRIPGALILSTSLEFS